MSFVMFLIVGLSAGVVLYAMSYERLPLGLIGSVAGGLAASVAGGCLGALIAGSPLTEIRPATVGGCAIGAYAAVVMVAWAAHYRRTHGDFSALMRRIRR